MKPTAWQEVCGTDCTGKFKPGDRVRTRGDIGGFNLVVVRVHNAHYAECRGYGKLRHFNMNFLEKVSK